MRSLKKLSMFATDPRVLIGVAILLRLLFPTVFVFKEDEARALFYALEVIEEHKLLTHTWLSSVGITNSPVFVYMIAPFVYLSRSPVFVTFCLNLLNLASILVVYAIFKRLCADRREALLTTVFYALSPLAIAFSRKIWDPVPMPFFSAMLFYAALRVLTGKKSRWALVLVSMLFLVPQVHQSGIFFAFIVVVALTISRPRLNAGASMGGLAIGILIALPYLSYLASSDISAPSIFKRFFAHWAPDIDVVTNFLLNLTGQNLFGIAEHDAVPLCNWPVPGFGALIGVCMLIAFPIIYHGCIELYSRTNFVISKRSAKPEERASCYNLLFLCVFGLPLLYLILGVPGVAHYFVVIFPLCFSLLALGITRIRRVSRSGFIRRYTALLPLLWILATAGYYSMLSYRHGGYSFGATYDFARRMAGALVKMADDVSLLNSDDQPGSIKHVKPDTIFVALEVPKLRSNRPPQWQYIFKEEFGVTIIPPSTGSYYKLTLEWNSSPWSRCKHSISRKESPASR